MSINEVQACRERIDHTTPSFVQAVRLVSDGKPMKVIAQDLGIALESPGKWVRTGDRRRRAGRLDNTGARRATATPTRSEDPSRGARDSKKAAAFFAKETDGPGSCVSVLWA